MRRLAAFVLAVLCAVPVAAQEQLPPGGIQIVTAGGGSGTPTYPLAAPAADNCAAVPYSFTSDTNTGLCSSVADSVSMITGGTARLTTSTASVTSTVPFLGADGTKAAPTYSFSGSTNTGLFQAGNVWELASGGTVTTLGQSNLLRVASATILGWSSNASAELASSDVGFARVAAGVLKIYPAEAAAGLGWLQQTGARSRLTGDYTNATASLTNTALSVTVITGRAYTFRLVLFADDSTAVDGGQIDFNGGAATATDFRAHCVLSSATGTTLAQANAASAALATVINATSFVATTQVMWECNGTFQPSSTGTFIVRAGKNSHTTGTLTIQQGSHLWIEDMP